MTAAGRAFSSAGGRHDVFPDVDAERPVKDSPTTADVDWPLPLHCAPTAPVAGGELRRLGHGSWAGALHLTG